MKILLILLIVFILGLIVLIYVPAFFTPSYKGPVTDHFDGFQFYNPDHRATKKSTGDIFKWWFSRERTAWPKHIMNKPHEPITAITNTHEIKITFVNHATALIQTFEVNMLTDPIWSERASPFSWYGPKRVRDPGLRFNELPRIDIVMVSHNHYDHLDLATLQKLEEKFHPVFLVPLGNKNFLLSHKIKNVIEMDWWQTFTFKNRRITFFPSQHWAARWLSDKDRTLWGSYGIEVLDKKIYFAGDTGYGSHFKIIKEKWGAPDFALLPIGSYLPRWFMHDNHMNPHEAVQAHLDLNAKKSIAIHYGTFQLSDEGIDQPVIDLKKALQDFSLAPMQFVILPEGQSVQ